MGLDVLDTLPLVSTKEYTTVSRLMADGATAPISFTREGERLNLDTTIGVFDPVILILK
jgi:hypothetical protein